MASKRLQIPLSLLCLAVIATAGQIPGNPIVYAQDGSSTFAMVNGQMIPIPPNDSSMLSSVKNFFKIDWSNNALVRSIKNISSFFSSQTPPPLEYVEMQGLSSNHKPQYAAPNGGQPNMYRPNSLQYQEQPKQPQFPPLHFNPYPNRPATFETLPPQQLRGSGPQLQANPQIFNRAFQQQQQIQSQYPAPQPMRPQFQQQPKQLPPPPINIMAPSAHQMPMRPQQQQQQPMNSFSESMPPAARSNIIKIPGGIEVITHEMPDGGLSLNNIEPYQSNEVPLDDAYHSSVVEPMPSRQSQQQEDPTETEFEGDNPCPVVGQWKWDGTYCIALGPMPRWACKPTDLVPTGRLAVCRNRIAYPNESPQK